MRSAQLATEPPSSRASRGELTLQGLDGEILLKDANTMVHQDSWSVGCVEWPQDVQHQPKQY